MKPYTRLRSIRRELFRLPLCLLELSGMPLPLGLANHNTVSAPSNKLATTLSRPSIRASVVRMLRISSSMFIVSSLGNVARPDTLTRRHTRDRIAPVARAGGTEGLYAEHVSCSGNQVADG